MGNRNNKILLVL